MRRDEKGDWGRLGGGRGVDYTLHGTRYNCIVLYCTLIQPCSVYSPHYMYSLCTMYYVLYVIIHNQEDNEGKGVIGAINYHPPSSP